MEPHSPHLYYVQKACEKSKEFKYCNDFIFIIIQEFVTTSMPSFCKADETCGK